MAETRQGEMAEVRGDGRGRREMAEIRGDGRGKLCHYYDGDSAPRILMRKIMTRTRRHIHNTSSKSTSHSCYLTSFWDSRARGNDG